MCLQRVPAEVATCALTVPSTDTERQFTFNETVTSSNLELRQSQCASNDLCACVRHVPGRLSRPMGRTGQFETRLNMNAQKTVSGNRTSYSHVCTCGTVLHAFAANCDRGAVAVSWCARPVGVLSSHWQCTSAYPALAFTHRPGHVCMRSSHDVTATTDTTNLFPVQPDAQDGGREQVRGRALARGQAGAAPSRTPSSLRTPHS